MRKDMRFLKQFSAFCKKNIYQYAFLDANLVPFDESLREKCVENLCGQYGKKWTCPPSCEKISFYPDHLKRFSRALIFSTLQPAVDLSDSEAVQRSREKHLKIEQQIESFFEMIPYRLFSAGACNLCKECTYPYFPCRFPVRAKMPCEAAGINVFRLVENMNMKSSDEEGGMIWFSVIFF